MNEIGARRALDEHEFCHRCCGTDRCIAIYVGRTLIVLCEPCRKVLLAIIRALDL